MFDRNTDGEEGIWQEEELGGIQSVKEEGKVPCLANCSMLVYDRISWGIQIQLLVAFINQGRAELTIRD